MISRMHEHESEDGSTPARCRAFRTRRPIAVNNSLSHGICNYNCTLCGVNKSSYCGPREFQPRQVTETLIRGIQEAAAQGLRVRYVANAGDGEPTLHPEFAQRMDLFGRMVREWNQPGIPAPEVSVVTNGSRLLEPGIMDAFERNPLTLIVSFPTPDPEAYGQLMAGDPRRGRAMLDKVVPGIRKALTLHGQGRIQRVQFHISPPDRAVVRRDFERTLRFLAASARSAGVRTLEMILFPATSNRAGLVRSHIRGCDMYRDLIRRYNGRRLDGVTVRLSLSFRRFFPKWREFIDLLRAFDHPCTWNSQLFITATGDSTCCNDQAVRNPMGNIRTDSLAALMSTKENHRPGRVCAGCDQQPARMTGSPLTLLFSRLALLKHTWVVWGARRRSPRTLPRPGRAGDREAGIPLHPNELPVGS